MIPNYIKRSLETVVKKALSEFPAAVLTDPRQSGKTTPLKAIFGRKFDYVSLPIAESIRRSISGGLLPERRWILLSRPAVDRSPSR